MKFSYLDTTQYQRMSERDSALRSSLKLARKAEKAGFHRYWVVEHHDHPEMACAAPTVLLGALTAVTNRIRLGSGGIMLSNHVPVVVAGQVRILEALAPGRIDLGVGRGRGASGIALDRLAGAYGDFEARFSELQKLVTINKQVKLNNISNVSTPIYVLGTSISSAVWAAQRGCMFAFAQHLSTDDAGCVAQCYRDNFVPEMGSSPYFILALQICTANDNASAHSLAIRLATHRLRRMLVENEGIEISEDVLLSEHISGIEIQAAKSILEKSKIIVGCFRSIKEIIFNFDDLVCVDELMVSSFDSKISSQVDLIESLGVSSHCF